MAISLRWRTHSARTNKDNMGLALDGHMKHKDSNLASSTLIHDPTQKENMGIIVQLKVKVKLNLGPLCFWYFSTSWSERVACDQRFS